MKIPKSFSDPFYLTMLVSRFGRCSETYPPSLTETCSRGYLETTYSCDCLMSRKELLEKKGASLLEPMKGKPMKEYVVLPNAWRNQHETARLWVARSLNWTNKLPPKKTKE